MTLKNYTSSGKNTFEKIQRILATHGASKVMFDYRKDGTLEAISFALDLDGKVMGFRLPAMVENVVKILYGGEDRWGRPKKITDAQREQAYKTAWANIRDWIDAQMALVDTRQVKIHQVFLPYLVMKDNRTLGDHFESNHNLLTEGKI
ncbi:MAG: hypothetical protein WCW77_00600 [Patescibacteria group bacterium]|jgi:hypothetical protein